MRTAPEGSGAEREAVVGAACFAGAVLALVPFTLAGLGLGLSLAAALLFASFASLTLLRWFGRAHTYFHRRQARVFVSDLIYSSVLLGALALMWLWRGVSLEAAYASMSAAAFLAMIPFGGSFAKVLVARLGRRPIRDYARMSRQQAPWSLLAVICTDLTANAHAYVVTFWAGTESYASIAATALLIRPVSVASSALRDVERPRFARLVGAARFSEIFSGIKLMRWALAMVWLVTVAAVALLFFFEPRLLFPAAYSLDTLLIGSALWLLVSGLAMLRVPESALLQAVGSFRDTALAGVYAAAVSVAAVVLLTLFAGPVWSILGIFVGQAVNALLVARLSSRWRRAHSGGSKVADAGAA
jgi:O-antigen/teichoic acid export membrane protein